MDSQTTEVFSGPTIACIADPSSNILVNGGFDDDPGNNEWHDIDPTPWGNSGEGWGPIFYGPVDDAQTPSNYVSVPWQF